MSSDELNGFLEKALEMTRSMLLYAQEENWVELAKLEGERQELFQSLPNTQSIQKNKEFEEKIQQILVIDREMQALVVKARDEVRDEIIQLNKDKSAVKAYEAK